MAIWFEKVKGPRDLLTPRRNFRVVIHNNFTNFEENSKIINTKFSLIYLRIYLLIKLIKVNLPV